MSATDEPLGYLKSSWRGAMVRWPLVAGIIALALLALVLVSPAWSLWFLIAALVTVLVWAVPLAGLYLLPFAVAFGAVASVSVGHLTVGPTDVLVAMVALTLLIRTLLPRIRHARAPRLLFPLARAHLQFLWRTRRPPFVIFAALAGYLIVVVLSTLVAHDRTEALKEVVKWCEVLAVLAGTYWLVQSPAHVRGLVWAMIAAGVAEALLGDVQWVFASGDLGPGGASVRVFGTFAQPNPYAGYLNFALPLAVALTLFARERREQWVAGAAACLVLAAHIFADSRGAYLGLAAAVLAIVIVGWQKERQALLFGAGALAVACVAWTMGKLPTALQSLPQTLLHVAGGTLPGQVTSQNFSTMERLAHWIAGLRMFETHALLGVGAGNYTAAYPRYALADWPEPLGHAHNYYINVAAETGILGLGAFLLFIGAMLYVGWRSAQGRSLNTSARDIPTLALAVGLFAVLVALCVHNLTDDLFVHAMELQLALCLGCILRLKAQTERAR